MRISGTGLHLLPPPKDLPDEIFADVLAARRSSTSGPVQEEQLSTLLWHSLRPRRGGQGRFGSPWEGRAAPSAGGLHVISILTISIDDRIPVGLYDTNISAIFLANNADALRQLNADSVATLCSAASGITLQFVADFDRLEHCYDHAESLLWRDSGALAATVCMVATCLGLTSVVLGRTGTEFIELAGLDGGLVGAGAVHIGRRVQEP